MLTNFHRGSNQEESIKQPRGDLQQVLREARYAPIRYQHFQKLDMVFRSYSDDLIQKIKIFPSFLLFGLQ